MDENTIARITLNPGRVGWFDPITNIHLTIGSPEAFVTKNMNTKNIQKAIKANIIRVLWGNLSNPQMVIKPQATKISQEKEVITPAVVIQETSEETQETPEEKPVQESTTPKKANKKKNKGGE